MTNEINYLKILTYNVEGLKTKLDDPTFLKMLRNYDVIVLLETWLSEEEKQCLDIENFWSYSQIRPKHKKAFRQYYDLGKGFFKTRIEISKRRGRFYLV